MKMLRHHILLACALMLGLSACSGMSSHESSVASPKRVAAAPKSRPVYQGPTTRITVAKGDTVYALSRRYRVKPSAIIGLNNLPAPYALKVGDSVLIPGDVTPIAAPPARTASARTDNAPLPPRASTRFLWPANGPVISSFGNKPGGLKNDGINIQLPPGTPVKAAEAGVVAYAGKELEGYGYMVLIRHAGGWVTAYAHNGELLVKRGDTVSKGQVIAKSGATGNVTNPQLHFEVRQKTQAVNPIAYLDRQG